jgi:UDP:flavonoid glycosyltransferase YjiC (YdhE family)/glycosyltransferase involved in cell wall biosynthesis
MMRSSKITAVATTRHDVAIMSDFRYPGGTSSSLAEEIQAQAAAGLSTILLQVRSPHLKSIQQFNPHILECLRQHWADLAVHGDAVSARVLVIRHPRIFAADLPMVPEIEADEIVMVVNQAPQDRGQGRVYYDIDDVRRRVEGYFGDRVRWAAIGPLVRDQVLAASPNFPLSPDLWHNIIDVNAWHTNRDRPLGSVPVIGRHSRPAPVKWPVDAEEILQAYPSHPDFRVRVLGGGDIAVKRVGHRPSTWELLTFGSMHPKEFLRTIDFFVYYHDPNLVEAFGRTVLEAMASGVPVIVPYSFKVLFEEAALYATPADVKNLVRGLHADWDTYRKVSAGAQAFVRERFSYQAHISRLAQLGVQRSVLTTQVDARSAARRANPSGPRRRLLLLSSNGAGLGHLTRLSSIARRLPGEIEVVFATQSYAAPIVEQEGFLTEYIPSRKQLDIPSKRWDKFLYDRLMCLVNTHEPNIVAVDGTVPYWGLIRTMAKYPDTTWVWIRRAMWKRDEGARWLERGEAFDFVLEPGEFAASMDQGPTVARRHQAKQVGPIVYFDSGELMDRESARGELGIDDRPAALLQLGAGNINDISSPIARIASHLQSRNFQVVLAESPISTRSVAAPAGVKVVKVYPLSRYLRGFDLVVSAAGYNSFHELIAFGVPSIFMPNEQTALDDQVARARFASDTGAALLLNDPSGHEVDDILELAVRPEVRAQLAHRCAELAAPNGAWEAAAWLDALSTTRTKT